MVVFLLFHVVNVQGTIQCARTFDEWNKASASLHCKEPNFYHCLKNENGNFTQHCLQRVWIQEGMCPEFNSRVRRIDVFQCQSDENNCPNTIYWSNAVYLYPVCYDKITPETKESTTLSSTATSIDTSSGNNQNNGNLKTILAIVLSLVGAGSIGIVFCVFYLRRRRKNRENNTDSCDIALRKKEDK